MRSTSWHVSQSKVLSVWSLTHLLLTLHHRLLHHSLVRRASHHLLRALAHHLALHHWLSLWVHHWSHLHASLHLALHLILHRHRALHWHLALHLALHSHLSLHQHLVLHWALAHHMHRRPLREVRRCVIGGRNRRIARLPGHVVSHKLWLGSLVHVELLHVRRGVVRTNWLLQLPTT